MSDQTGPPAPAAEDAVDPVALEQLRAAANEVEPEVAARLHDMRRAAVGQVDQPRQGFFGGWRLTGPAIAAAASLVLVVAVTWNRGDSMPDMPAADESELAAVQDIELLEQLEFIAWLEEAGSGAG